MQEEKHKTSKKFGNRLATILKREGCSQKDLAGLLGVHINTVSQWLRNINEPNLTTLRLISHYLDIEYTWLITGETPIEYAARKHTRKLLLHGEVLLLSDGKADYGEQTKKEVEDLVAKIVNLDPSSRKLVKELVNKLGGEK